MTNALERLGLIETGLTNTVHLKEHIAAVVKAENEKSIQQLKYQHEEDRAQLKKLSKEFEAHRTLTKMWISHMIKKTLDPLSPQDISKIQGAFALFDKAGAGTYVFVCLCVCMCVVWWVFCRLKYTKTGTWGWRGDFSLK